VRAHAFGRARPQIPLNPRQRGGGYDAQVHDLALQAIRVVGDPPPVTLTLFPWGDGWGSAHHGDEIAMPTH
jgi:hypothetical protein